MFIRHKSKVQWLGWVGLWTLKSLGLAKPNLKQEGMRRAYARCQDVAISVSRCRENPDSPAIFAPKFAARQRQRIGRGVDACPEKGGRGGLGVNPDHPSQPKTRTGCGWGKGGNTKGGSEVKSFPLLLAPPNPPRATPLLTSYDAQTLGRVSAVVAGKFQVSRTSKFSNLTTSKASTTISTSTLD